MANSFRTPEFSHLVQKRFATVYTPAEDSFLFLDALEKDWSNICSLRPTICLEIGCGSGIISTFLSENVDFGSFILDVDLNKSALEATGTTMSSVSAKRPFDLLQSDLCAALLPAAKDRVDLLLFNPPYVVTEDDEVGCGDIAAAAWAGGRNGRQVIDRFIPQAVALLRPGGIWYLLCVKENDIDDLSRVLLDSGFSDVSLILRRKCRNEDLMVLRITK